MSSTMPIDQLLKRLDSLTTAVLDFAKQRGSRLTRIEVCERLGIHRNTLNDYIADHEFPTAARDGKWLLYEVVQWEIYRDATRSAEIQYTPRPSTKKTGFHLYRHFDITGQLLYVGVSLNALGRLREHRQTSHWSGSIARVEITHWNSRADSLLAEQQAIKSEKPLFNVAHKKGTKP